MGIRTNGEQCRQSMLVGAGAGVRGSWWFAVALLCVSALGVAARAQDEPSISARLSVSGTPACAKASEIEGRVTSRTDRIRFENSSRASRQLRVQFSEPGPGVRAELAVVSESGKRSRRTIQAADCSEAWDALGLVIALAFDPSAKLELESEATDDTADATDADGASTNDPQAAPAPGEGDASTGARDDRAGRTGELSAATATSVDSPLSPRDEGSGAGDGWWSTEPEIAWRVGLAGQVITGVAPDWMPGANLFVGVSFDYPALISPALFAGFARHWRSGVEAQGGSADFRLDLAMLDVCPFALRSAALALRACLASSLGNVHAEGSNTSQPESHDRPWRSVGGSLLATWTPAPLLEVMGAARFSSVLVRDSYQFAPNVFHEAPAAGLAGSLGAAFRFP